MSENKLNMGEKALSKVVESGVDSQLDEAEKFDVEIRTDPIKLMQGKVDAVAISGEGLVVKQDLRMASVQLNTGSIEVNPISAALGKVELTQSADAQAEIVLTEADLNRALGSDYLHSKMQNIEVKIENEKRMIDVQQVQINLLRDQQIAIKADLFLQDTSDTVGFSAIAKPHLQEDGQRIALEIISAEGRGLSLAMAKALFEKIMELLDFRNFDIKGVRFWLKQLHVQPGRLLIQATSVIEQFPSF